MTRSFLFSIFTLVVAIDPSLATAQVTRSFTMPIERRLVAANQPDVVTELLVNEGSLVNSGDVIAELDNSVLKKQLQIANLRAESNAAIQAAEVEFDSHEKRFEQLQSMLDKGHANPAEIDKAEAALKSSAAELELARQKKKEFGLEVERIKAEIEQNVVRSPIEGVVTEIHVRPGEYIASNERKVATVVRLNQLRVRFHLLENTTAKIDVGQRVEIAIGHRGNVVTGVVEFVSPVIDPDSGTSRLDVILENSDREIRSGSVCFWLANSPSIESVPVPVTTGNRADGHSNARGL